MPHGREPHRKASVTRDTIVDRATFYGVGVRIAAVVLVVALLAACAGRDPLPPPPPPTANRWTHTQCMDEARVIGLMMHEVGADDLVEFSLVNARDHGCEIRSAAFDRVTKEGLERAEGAEDDLAALAKCARVERAAYEARQIGDLVTARAAERYYERHCN